MTSPALDAPTINILSPKRIDANEALHLFQHADLLSLGAMAESVKKKFHDENAPITFVIDRNINYTNICNVDCGFCAFYRHEDAPDAYTLTYDQIKPKIDELVAAQGTQILLQGGVNPNLPLEYYTELVRAIRTDYPTLTIHAFSPTELSFLGEKTGLGVKAVLEQLMDAGMSSLPGAGGEILHDDIRRRVSPKKVDTEDWLGVMETAHGLGLKTSATMMFGMMEKDWHIVDHLFRIRELQDKTGGFLSFIPWTFQKAHTKLEKSPRPAATGMEYLRVSALARIVLDNVPNIGASWITQGLKLGETACMMGANDLGGLMLEENVVTQAGISPTTKTIAEMCKAIHGMGRDAAQRDTDYSIIRRFPKNNTLYQP
ncbi:MAG: cyclic dehypoxanthinyl futalosine synthase [Vampirovibrionales bacterium]|nr:cyclic dehypoxanthinyl futalosine synthase [Vampirovibrionales bacterium]